MTQSLTKPATYSAALDALRHSRGQASPQWLADLGDQAWARFTELGFPTARRGNEKWKYTNVAPIARAAFGYAWDLDPDEDPAAGRLRHFGLLDEAWINLVFVDGRFSGSLSNRPETAKGVTVTSLFEAVNRDGEIVQRHLAEYAGFQDDGFTALNTAFLSDGAFVHVPRNHSSVPPVHLVFLTTNRELPRAVHPRTLIVVEENAALSVVETYAGPSNEQYFTNAVTEISVGDGSRVEHHRLSLEGANSYHVGFGRVRQGRDSSFSSVSLALGNTLGRNDFEVLLDGPGGSCALSGLYLTAEGQHVDNLIGIDHAKPNTSSRLNYKGILDGQVQGRVRRPGPGAQGRSKGQRPADRQKPAAFRPGRNRQQAQPLDLRRRRQVRPRRHRRPRRPGLTVLPEKPRPVPRRCRPDADSRLRQGNHRFSQPGTVARVHGSPLFGRHSRQAAALRGQVMTNTAPSTPGGPPAAAFDVARIRQDFPILEQTVNGKPLVYLDNAATSQKPRSVIDAVARYYATENSNIHRGVHTLSQMATDDYEEARSKVQRFINAPDLQEIVFVRGTTEGINLVAQTFGRANLHAGDEIVVSAMEHHSNIVPWQMLCQQTGAKLRVIPMNDAGELLVDEYEKLLNPRTKLVSIAHVSNALGTINPVKTMVRMARARGAHVLLDGAQAVPHCPVDVQDLDCDFYAFSGHKLYGPHRGGSSCTARPICWMPCPHTRAAAK